MALKPCEELLKIDHVVYYVNLLNVDHTCVVLVLYLDANILCSLSLTGAHLFTTLLFHHHTSMHFADVRS